MTARIYDVILTVDDVSNFQTSNVLVGNTTGTVGVIAGIDSANNLLKVRIANTLQEYSSSEVVHSNVINTFGTANGAINSGSVPFYSNIAGGSVTTAIANVTATAPSSFIAEKNAFTQNPIVRLYSIYYPGEWFPTNEYGNPTNQGEGRAWPNEFPIRFAEIVGDTAEDLQYNVIHKGESYAPFPVNLSGMEQGADGKINELSITVFNVDNVISRLVEDPFLLGNNTSNSVMAHVNGELVHGIDPRTVNANPSDLGTEGEEAFDLLTRARANGLVYNSAIEAYYGRANASFNKTQTELINGTWQRQKEDTRDLQGGVVTIRTTFANFLDYWPEYSLVANIASNVVTVLNGIAYRTGDNVVSSRGGVEATVQRIEDNSILYLSNALDANTIVGDAVYVVNLDADSDSYLEDVFKIDQLESLNEYVATFGLVSWLQYFKIVVPKRKYYKNTCQWKYKGEECQYPGPGGLPIPGSNKVSNTNPIAANNEAVLSATDDVCGKSFEACRARNNEVHFGGFPGTGRTIPRA
jgi:phage-related protein